MKDTNESNFNCVPLKERKRSNSLTMKYTFILCWSWMLRNPMQTFCSEVRTSVNQSYPSHSLTPRMTPFDHDRLAGVGE